jgi:type VI protein secretion system component Hcp
MAKKAKKTAKLHKGKKLEAQKALKVSQAGFSIVKHADQASPKLY